MTVFRIKKGDTVEVITGDERGARGTVQRVFPRKKRVVVQGLNIIKKNEGKIKSRGLMRKMLNFMNRGGSKRLKLSRFNMFGLGTWMMKKLMKDINSPSLDELIKMAQDMGVKLVPCSTTCNVMGLSEKDAFRENIASLAGAAFFLNEARESKITLFI